MFRTSARWPLDDVQLPRPSVGAEGNIFSTRIALVCRDARERGNSSQWQGRAGPGGDQTARDFCSGRESADLWTPRVFVRPRAAVVTVREWVPQLAAVPLKGPFTGLREKKEGFKRPLPDAAKKGASYID